MNESHAHALTADTEIAPLMPLGLLLDIQRLCAQHGDLAEAHLQTMAHYPELGKTRIHLPSDWKQNPKHSAELSERVRRGLHDLAQQVRQGSALVKAIKPTRSGGITSMHWDGKLETLFQYEVIGLPLLACPEEWAVLGVWRTRKQAENVRRRLQACQHRLANAAEDMEPKTFAVQVREYATKATEDGRCYVVFAKWTGDFSPRAEEIVERHDHFIPVDWSKPPVYVSKAPAPKLPKTWLSSLKGDD